jgi:AcrR family transcriptional regulator
MPARETPGDRWTRQLQRGGAPRTPITVDRIVDAAFALVRADGFDALTMRRVAAALDTGPASLYAHVRNKAELDDLLIGAICSRVDVPTPDGSRWQEQITAVCAQLRDEYLRFPGVSRAAFTALPMGIDTLRLSEGMLGILLAGGIDPQAAAWGIDAAFLYVSAYALEASLRRPTGDGDGDVDERVTARAEIVAAFRELPVDRFPNTVAHAEELTSGAGHERFDFTLGLLFRGLVR